MEMALYVLGFGGVMVRVRVSIRHRRRSQCFLQPEDTFTTLVLHLQHFMFEACVAGIAAAPRSLPQLQYGETLLQHVACDTETESLPVHQVH